MELVLYLIERWKNDVPYNTKEPVTAWSVENVEGAHKQQYEELHIQKIQDFSYEKQILLTIITVNVS